MEKGTCCPHGSWPRLQANYQSKGQNLQIANTQCYHIGQGNKVLLMVSDIFGSKSGHHQSFADTFSSFGYNVYLPQILSQPYNGQMSLGPIIQKIKNQNYELMRQRFLGVAKYLQQKGHKNFYIVAFCWGVWFSFKMAAQSQNIISIAGMHPSIGLEQVFGGDVNKLAENIKCPAYFYPAGNDPANIKPEGEIVKILNSKFGEQKCGTHQFPDMIHGWTVRGDINDQKVKRDVEQAIRLCKQYFEKFQ